MSPLISIIIPTYNVAKYIEKCIASITSQHVDCEIIVVDDGSTDETLDILRDISISNTQIKIFECGHTNAGHARNFGLNNASGEYIWFIDGDDWIKDDSLSSLKNIVEESKPDVVMFNYNKYFELQDEFKPITVLPKIATEIKLDKSTVEIVVDEHISELINTSVVPWNKLIKKSHILANHLEFDSLQSANDRSFYFKLISSTKNITYFLDNLVNYRIRDNALTSKITDQRLSNSIASFNSTMSHINKSNSELVKSIFKATVSDIVWMIKNVSPEIRWNFFKRVVHFFNDELCLKIDDLYKSMNIDYSYYSLIKSRTFLDNYKESDCVPIILASDMNYISYAAVTIQSIIDNASSEKLYDIYILHSSKLGMSNINRIRAMSSEKIRITFVNISAFLKNVKLYSRAHYSVEMFNRILIPDIFPYYEKILYVDCDIVIRSDISELYNLPLGDNCLGAVKCDSQEEMQRYVRNVLKIKNNEYFNSGVLLFNNDSYRRNNIKEKCFELIKNNQTYVCPDQDILNITCYKKTMLLPNDDWNFQWHVGMNDGYNSRYKNQKLIHYTSGNKAWNRPDWELSQYFWKYARETCFYEEIVCKMVEKDMSRKSSQTSQKIEKPTSLIKRIKKALSH